MSQFSYDLAVAYRINPKMSTSPPPVFASDKFKLEATELGKETVAGHPCVKNKVIVTDDKGDKHESTV